MTYVPRRILQTSSNGKTLEVSESEFISGEGPRILLGEPGAGKSETAAEIAKLSGGRVVHAELIASNASIEHDNDQLIVVDGIDELASGDQKDPIATILNHFHTLHRQYKRQHRKPH